MEENRNISLEYDKETGEIIILSDDGNRKIIDPNEQIDDFFECCIPPIAKEKSKAFEKFLKFSLPGLSDDFYNHSEYENKVLADFLRSLRDTYDYSEHENKISEEDKEFADFLRFFPGLSDKIYNNLERGDKELADFFRSLPEFSGYDDSTDSQQSQTKIQPIKIKYSDWLKSKRTKVKIENRKLFSDIMFSLPNQEVEQKVKKFEDTLFAKVLVAYLFNFRVWFLKTFYENDENANQEIKRIKEFFIDYDMVDYNLLDENANDFNKNRAWTNMVSSIFKYAIDGKNEEFITKILQQAKKFPYILDQTNSAFQGQSFLSQLTQSNIIIPIPEKDDKNYFDITVEQMFERQSSVATYYAGLLDLVLFEQMFDEGIFFEQRCRAEEIDSEEYIKSIKGKRKETNYEQCLFRMSIYGKGQINNYLCGSRIQMNIVNSVIDGIMSLNIDDHELEFVKNRYDLLFYMLDKINSFVEEKGNSALEELNYKINSPVFAKTNKNKTNDDVYITSPADFFIALKNDEVFSQFSSEQKEIFNKFYKTFNILDSEKNIKDDFKLCTLEELKNKIPHDELEKIEEISLRFSQAQISLDSMPKKVKNKEKELYEKKLLTEITKKELKEFDPKLQIDILSSIIHDTVNLDSKIHGTDIIKKNYSLLFDVLAEINLFVEKNGIEKFDFNSIVFVSKENNENKITIADFLITLLRDDNFYRNKEQKETIDEFCKNFNITNTENKLENNSESSNIKQFEINKIIYNEDEVVKNLEALSVNSRFLKKFLNYKKIFKETKNALEEEAKIEKAYDNDIKEKNNTSYLPPRFLGKDFNFDGFKFETYPNNEYISKLKKELDDLEIKLKSLDEELLDEKNSKEEIFDEILDSFSKNCEDCLDRKVKRMYEYFKEKENNISLLPEFLEFLISKGDNYQNIFSEFKIRLENDDNNENNKYKFSVWPKIITIIVKHNIKEESNFIYKYFTELKRVLGKNNFKIENLDIYNANKEFEGFIEDIIRELNEDQLKEVNKILNYLQNEGFKIRKSDQNIKEFSHYSMQQAVGDYLSKSGFFENLVYSSDPSESCSLIKYLEFKNMSQIIDFISDNVLILENEFETIKEAISSNQGLSRRQKRYFTGYIKFAKEVNSKVTRYKQIISSFSYKEDKKAELLLKISKELSNLINNKEKAELLLRILKDSENLEIDNYKKIAIDECRKIAIDKLIKQKKWRRSAKMCLGLYVNEVEDVLQKLSKKEVIVFYADLYNLKKTNSFKNDDQNHLDEVFEHVKDYICNNRYRNIRKQKFGFFNHIRIEDFLKSKGVEDSEIINSKASSDSLDSEESSISVLNEELNNSSINESLSSPNSIFDKSLEGSLESLNSPRGRERSNTFSGSPSEPLGDKVIEIIKKTNEKFNPTKIGKLYSSQIRKDNNIERERSNSTIEIPDKLPDSNNCGIELPDKLPDSNNCGIEFLKEKHWNIGRKRSRGIDV